MKDAGGGLFVGRLDRSAQQFVPRGTAGPSDDVQLGGPDGLGAALDVLDVVVA